ncbi:MAG: phosphoribosylanthranilate isomerase [Bacteroidales bacterium]|nr:phosphoribosylanthranilate isomerase [Bacteroidales bacterium]
MKVKICGLRDKDNIREIAGMKPDYLGFIFYKASPRYAGDILDVDTLNELDEGLKKVGVFVNEDINKVVDIALAYGLDVLQLHGNENPAYCRELRGENFEIIKAFNPLDKNDFVAMKEYHGSCDYFLLDNRGRMAGGSGQKFDWEILDKYKLDIPFFLSGGIGPGDSEQLLSMNYKNMTAIDINSRFEIAPGVKDPALVEEFLNKIRIK